MSSENSGRHAGNRAGDGRQTWNVTHATKKDISRGNVRPTLLKDARETDSRRHHNRRGTPGGCGDGGIGHGGKRTIPPWADRGERGQLPGRYGIRGVHSGCADLEEVGSCGGRANQVLGAAVLSGRTSARVQGQSETYRDSGNSGHKMELHSGGNRRRKGILGNDFAMAHKLTVRPCEGAMYLTDLSGTRKEHMGERLPCTIRSVTEVWAVTEETLAVRAVGSPMLAPHTVTQVRVIVPTPRARGTVMIETGPGARTIVSSPRSS